MGPQKLTEPYRCPHTVDLERHCTDTEMLIGFPKMTPNRLTERRREIGLHQNELAHIAGITPAYLSMMESGKRPITPEMARRLEQAILDAPELRRNRRAAAQRAVAAAMNKSHLRQMRADTKYFSD